MEAKQIQPNHADHISGYKEAYLEKMLKTEPVIAQYKYDGERMLIHICNGQVWCTSRRISKKTGRYMENQDKLPYLVEAIRNCVKLPCGYTVLDCECYLNNWSTIAGILHSLPERAKELQKDEQARFAVFDCLFYAGEDMRDKRYSIRQKAAEHIVNLLDYSNVHMVREFKDFMRTRKDWETAMDIAIGNGFEGIVLKSWLRGYYDEAASLKCKRIETVDVVVIDYKPGNGKYSDTIGALKVGYYDPDDGFHIISNVNCSTDEERNAWRDHWSEWQYSVIEVKCQEITEKSLRHPRYVRRRPDKDYTMVTRNTIFK